MFASLPTVNLKKLLAGINWPMLVFLLLFVDVKTPVKLVALLFIYIVQPNFKFGFSFKNSRLPLFYPIIIVIALVAMLVNRDFLHHDYLLLLALGICCWPLALLAMHQVKLMVDKTDNEVIYRTIIAFFIVNAVVSAGNLFYIMLQTHSIDPYTFRGLNERYFINTGDDIKGISFDISSTNCVLCAFGVFYFLSKKNLAMMVICMGTLLLTFSNLISIVFLLLLLFLLIFKSTRDQKSLIVISFVLYVVAMVKVSPENENYIREITKYTLNRNKPVEDKGPQKVVAPKPKPDSLLTFEEKRYKIANHYLDSLSYVLSLQHPVRKRMFPKNVALTDQGRMIVPEKDITFDQNYYSLDVITDDRQQLIDFINAHKPALPMSTNNANDSSLPGKVLGAVQTFKFFKAHPAKSIVGMGIGNFSSKIAFRAAGAGIRGDYPKKHLYVNPDFMGNHLDLYLSFFSKSAGFRSVRNNPYSVYDQMLGEYGVLGLAALFIFYFGFFAKNYKKLTYGLPILLLTLFVFNIDYWFEQLSAVVFFELFLFLNIKENSSPQLITDAA